MLKSSYSNKFKKSYKKIPDNRLKEEIKEVIKKLIEKEKLDVKYKDHDLKGNFKGCRECHIKPDLLLIYKVENDNIYFYRLGSHSDLF